MSLKLDILMKLAYDIMEGIDLEEYYRQNVIDFAMIQLGKSYVWGMNGPDEFDEAGFPFYIFKELFEIDIEQDGFGGNEITKQMTNSIGNLTQYIENDSNKEKYLEDIKAGDLVFFHTKALEENQATSCNQYPGHVGIYLGKQKFIHVSAEVGCIIIDDLNGDWLKKLVASRDIVASVL